MEIDEYGRMYVVEMHSYPLDRSETGKVKLLTDTDGGGIIDNRSVFAERLILPTGVMCWKQGLIVNNLLNGVISRGSGWGQKSRLARRTTAVRITELKATVINTRTAFQENFLARVCHGRRSNDIISVNLAFIEVLSWGQLVFFDKGPTRKRH